MKEFYSAKDFVQMFDVSYITALKMIKSIPHIKRKSSKNSIIYVKKEEFEKFINENTVCGDAK